HVRSAQGGRQGEVAAGQRRAEAQDVRRDTGVFAGEEGATATEAGGDLVSDQQHAVVVAEASRFGEETRRVEVHAPGALHDGFEDQRGDVLVLLLEQYTQRLQLAVRTVAAEGRLWLGDEE